MPNAVPQLHVSILGDARISTPNITLDPRAQISFAAGLYLILERTSPVSRHNLVSLLWPKVGREVGQHRLRQTLLKLRRYSVPIEPVGKSKVGLAECDIVVDYEIWDPELLRPDTFSSNQLIPFHGFVPAFSSAYAEWLDSKKNHVASIVAPRLLTWIAHHRNSADWYAVELSANALLQLSPFNEEATLALAEAHAMRGDKRSASSVLKSYLADNGDTHADVTLHARLMRSRILQDENREPQQTIETDLVGRKDVVRTFRDALADAKHGRSRGLMLVGDAGIGKSRLLLEVSKFGSLQGFATRSLNCRPSHRHRPLATFVEFAPILRAMPGALGCSPEAMHAINRLTRHDPAGIDETHEFSDPSWIYNGIHRALLDLVAAVADESPLLIRLEDVHWMDQSSAEILREMMETLPNCPVVFALSGRELPSAWITNPPLRLRTIDLPPLSPAESKDLARLLLGQNDAEISAPYLSWCVDVTEGNPYFLMEIISHWIESRVEHDVPPSLSAVLRTRLSRLDTQALQVLQTCALLENNSTLPRIEAVLEYSAHALLTALETLGAAHMLSTNVVGPDTPANQTVPTRHELLSIAALNALSPAARHFLHRRIGKVLEAEVDENYSAATLWDCAKHWQLAGDSKRAWHLATSCAAHLMKIGLPRAAATAYAKALSYCSTDAERIDILRGQTRAYYRLSEWVNVRDTASIVRALYARSRHELSVDYHDEVELMDLRAQWQTLDWESVLSRALTCLSAEDASDAHRAEAGVMALMLLGYKADEGGMRSAFETIEQIGLQGRVSKSTLLQAKMVYHTNFGDLTLAVSAGRDLVDAQANEGDFGELWRARCNAGVACRVAGLFAEARQHFAAAFDIAKSHNLSGAEQRTIPLAANLALEIGDTSEARTLYDRFCEFPMEPSNHYSQLERDSLGARLALLDGDGMLARSRFSLSFDRAYGDSVPQRRTYSLALFIATKLANAGVPTNLEVEKLRNSFQGSKRGLHQAFNAFVLATALRKRGDHEIAATLLNDYEQQRREPWPAPLHILKTLEANSLF